MNLVRMVDISSCKVGTGIIARRLPGSKGRKRKGGRRAGTDIDSNVDGEGETPESVVQRQERSREGPT